RVARGRSLNVGRHDTHRPEFRCHLGQRGDPGTVNAIVIRDKDPHGPYPCKGAASAAGGPDLGCDGWVAMRIALIHNAASGRGVSPASLRELIEREGHELVRVIEHASDCASLADPPAELVVAGGGD